MSRNIDYNKLYKRYLREYNAARLELAIKDLSMYSTPLTKNEFKFSAKVMRKEDKMMPSQIINTIVKEQKYKYSNERAKTWRAAAEKYDLDWKDLKLRNLRAGAVDVSALNEQLKAMGITSGYDRARIIGEEFFGVDPITGKSK